MIQSYSSIKTFSLATLALLALSNFYPDQVFARNAPKNTVQSPESKIKALSDEDILNPKKLAFDKVLPLVDSFDGAPVGQVFVSKRSVLGNPKVGVIGEKGSSRYMQYCLLFCPNGTTEIDATYVYVIEKKGECTIGARGIGWADKTEEFQGGLFTGRKVETGRVRYTSTASNIDRIGINGTIVQPPLNQSQLTGPHGTNFKYFPRNKDFLGDQTTANEGYITDIHFFSANALVAAARSTQQIVIQLPNWQPSKHVISGKPFEELKSLLSKCEE